MKRTYLSLVFLLLTIFANSQTTIFSRNFNSGDGGFFVLTGNGGGNKWLVNSNYIGLNGFIADTPQQPAGIIGSPNSGYLHVTNSPICNGSGVCNANYDTGSTSDAQITSFSTINTTGYSAVSLSFWYLSAGFAGDAFGTVEYQIGGTGPWTQIGGQLQGITAWTQLTLSDPAFSNQAQLRFRFRWRNGNALGNDPAFSVDDVVVKGISTPPLGPVYLYSAVNGVGTNYTTLKNAFDAVNVGTYTGNLFIEIYGDTTETASAILNASGVGSSSYTAISIKPVGGVRSISGNLDLPMIDINGADNVTFDGAITGVKSLTISNSSISAISNTSTIRLYKDATSNVITNCIILGSSTMDSGTNGGNILFGASSLITGSDNNTVSNCTIGSIGLNYTSQGIHLAGTSTTINNSSNTINNNNFIDIFSDIVDSAGIFSENGSSDNIFTNNKFYQTTPKVFTASKKNVGIYITNSSGENFTITGNIIGFANNSGTGTYDLSGSSGKFYGIYFNGKTAGVVSNINNNSIANISLTGVTSFGTGIANPFSAIFIERGVVISNNNTIGVQTGLNSLVFSTNTSNATETFGLLNNNNANDSWTANTNNLGGININNSNTSGNISFTCIKSDIGLLGTFTAIANLIGGTIANSISSTTTSGNNCRLNGIYSNNSVLSDIKNNTIINLTTKNAAINGIWLETDSQTNIENNQIKFLTSDSTIYGVFSFTNNNNRKLVLLNNTIDGLKSFGLVIGASVNGLFIGTMNSININGNTIKNIENVGTLFTLMTGIYVTSAPAISQTIINNNIVDNVSANFSANGSTNVTGIHVNGFFNVSNNTIKNVSGFCPNNYINGLSIQSNLNVTNTVSKNLIFNITNQNTSSTFNSIISGITSSLSGGNALIEKNVIYGLKNLSQNATSKVIGFYNPNFGNYTFSNNMISISNSNLTNDIECYGVLDYGNVNGVSDRNFYHNSIYVSGNSIGTNATSAVILYRTLTTNVTNVTNNILEMRRTGGSKNYTISNPTSNSLSNFNCNYNILNNINSNQIALYNSTDYTFANWQTTTTKDTNSFTNQNINYTNPAIADLHLNLSCGSSGLTGTNIGILTDIDNQPRIVATPTIGADENAGNSTTWNGTSWNNGTPTLTSTVIIAGNYDMTLGATRPSIDACSLDLNSGTVTISSGKYINIQNNLTIANSASLNVLDKGSLVQINDLGTNTINGTFTVARAVNQNITRLDYVYWSSPVANFPIANVSITTTSNKIWEWTPYGNLINSPTFGTGNWLNASGNMTVGKGYIIRGPSTSLTPMPFSATFFGTPNNGINTPSISRGTYNSGTYFGTNGRPITNADDNWNLVGNPYPSAIKTLDFLALNPNIEGAIRLWTHGTPLSTANPNPFYNSYAANYAVSDYITYNGTGTTSGPLGFNGFIASGQSFFVNMNETTGSAFETIIFKNSLRSSGYDNSQFYKTNPVASTNQGRIWLNLVSNSTNEVSKILVGYVPIATNQKDRMFDALNVYGGSQTFSSLINNDMMIIQGRALPFDNQDIVPLAVEVVTAGNFSIAISEIDGLFSDVNQPIFLQDNLLNITHDLRQAPYQFNSLVGDYKNRFVMKYTNVASNAPGFNTLLNALNITSKDQTITIFSNTEKINAIEIYDILGRKLFETNNINDRSFSISNLAISTQSLIFKIKLESGELITRKVVL